MSKDLREDLEEMAWELAEENGRSLEWLTVSENWPEDDETPEEEVDLLMRQVYDRVHEILDEVFDTNGNL